jgi:hypothetical protein
MIWCRPGSPLAGRRPGRLGECLADHAAVNVAAGELLAQRWGPRQIGRHLRWRFPDKPGMRLCHESIKPGHLSARIAADAAIAAGTAAALAAAHRT